MKRIAVIGAGWSGLAAAVTLAKAGRAVDVFEASRSPGGRARRVTLGGAEVDNGQHILLGAYAGTLRLMREVGADPGDLLLRLPLALEIPGRFRLRAAHLPAPWHLAAGLAGATGLPWSEKLRAVRMLAALKQARFRVRPDISLAALLARYRQGPAACRYLWEPLCIAALNTAPSQASAAVFAAVLRDAFTGSARASDLLVPRADLGRLFPEPACAYVLGRGGGVHFGQAVRALRGQADGVAVETATESRVYEAAVCALPPARTADVLREAGPRALLDFCDTLAYEPIVTCYLDYPATVRLPMAMIGMDGELGQWAFDRGALGAAAGQVAVVVSAAGRLRDFAADELAARIHAELARLVKDLPAPTAHRVISERRATFRCTPGLTRPDPRATGIAQVVLAGDYLVEDYPATLEAAVRSGTAAARLLLEGARP